MEAGVEPPSRKEPVMRTLRHIVVLLLLALTLGVSAASASGPRASAPRDEPRPAVHSALDLLHRLGSLFTSVWSKNGCEIDPLGRCVKGTGGNGATVPPGNSTSNGDNGCSIDPWGGCTTGR